eukprot:6469941-Amphidinium_carterae.1
MSRCLYLGPVCGLHCGVLGCAVLCCAAVCCAALLVLHGLYCCLRTTGSRPLPVSVWKFLCSRNSASSCLRILLLGPPKGSIGPRRLGVARDGRSIWVSAGVCVGCLGWNNKRTTKRHAQTLVRSRSHSVAIVWYALYNWRWRAAPYVLSALFSCMTCLGSRLGASVPVGGATLVMRCWLDFGSGTLVWLLLQSVRAVDVVVGVLVVLEVLAVWSTLVFAGFLAAELLVVLVVEVVQRVVLVLLEVEHVLGVAEEVLVLLVVQVELVVETLVLGVLLAPDGASAACVEVVRHVVLVLLEVERVLGVAGEVLVLLVVRVVLRDQGAPWG